MKVRLLALAFGFSLVAGVAYAGPLPGGTDTDGDGVEDAFDNCTSESNAAQTDTDHNGCGNACTCVGSIDPAPCGPTGQATAALLCDGNGDTIVNAGDYSLILAEWDCPNPPGSNPACPAPPLLMDCNGDTVTNAGDYAVILAEWENSAGASGITSAQCNPATCQCTPQ